MASGLLEQSVIYLGAAIVVVPLVKKLKLSAVLGYLIAGILIGPFVLGLVVEGDEARSNVLHFAEFGVVMMLFLIGLELHPARLWKLRGPIIGMGGAQVILTSLVLSGSAYLMGQSLQSSIAIGMILSLSSTAIVIQTLNEKGLLKTPAGKNIFSVLLFQDIAVIPMLAALPLLVVSGSEQNQLNQSLISHLPAWIQAATVIGSVLLIILIGRFGLNHLLRLVAGTGIREIFTALALLIVIGISLLMQLVGLSPALGAFVAGVVLAESEYRHQLELDIEPFKGLLLGLFFMMVGAGIDFALFVQAPSKIFLLVIALILIKGTILFIIGKIFKMNLGKKILFSFSLAQAGEFAFVLFGMAINLNVLALSTAKELILVVALSMMLSPILMIVLDKWIMPRLNKKTPDESDSIENESNPVIIAGFGRFGQMIGRLLNANGIESTVLEFNSDHVETIRRFGQKVYYGDATRIDLLESAGAAEAKILIITIADRGRCLALIESVKKTFPHLKIFVRATNRQHAYELMEHNVIFERETLLSSLALGEKVLTELGYHPYRAHRAAKIFQAHDNKVMQQLVGVYRENRNEYIESSKNNERIIAEILQADTSEHNSMGQASSKVLNDEESDNEPEKN